MKYWKPEDFTFGRRLGEGATGTVFYATHNESLKEFAIKIVPRSKITKQNLKYLRREIEIHSRLRHVNIVRMFGYFSNEKSLYILLEYVDGGNLFDYTKANSPVPLSVVVPMMAKLTEALAYLNSLKVIHRDLKPENILISTTLDVKIADFGLCALEPISEKRYSCVGTLPFMSPEMAAMKGYDSRTDLWDLGLILYELLSGCPAVNASSVNQLLIMKPIEPPASWCEVTKDFFKQLTSLNSRPQVSDILKHKFFSL